MEHFEVVKSQLNHRALQSRQQLNAMAELTARQWLGRLCLRIKGRSFMSVFQPSDLMFLTDQWSRGRNLEILGSARAIGTLKLVLINCNFVTLFYSLSYIQPPPPCLYPRLNMN